jgi:hypothetical protein
MLYREIIAAYSEIHTKHINTLCGQNVAFKPQSVPRSKHSISVIKTNKLMLYRKIIAVCSEIHTKHVNTLCGQNVERLIVNHLGFKDNWFSISRSKIDTSPCKLSRHHIST